MEKMVNLWDETIDALREHGKTWNDVLYVCAGDVKVINFEGVARRTNYDADYGSQKVAFDLEVVGATFGSSVPSTTARNGGSTENAALDRQRARSSKNWRRQTSATRGKISQQSTSGR